MTLSRMDAIHRYRRLQQNPYACIEDLEELAAIHASRKLFEDPYSHIEEIEAYHTPVADASEAPNPIKSVTRDGKGPHYTEFEVERLARDLQRRMWNERAALLGASDAISPFAILDPFTALRYIGFEVQVVDSVGQYRDSRGSFEVAGLINKRQNLVQISSQLPLAFRNFTAAHELGHAVMHDLIEMHRDRPLDGSIGAKDVKEVQADKFAACFLMPRKLVLIEFERRFGKAPFSVDEATEFALLGAQGRRIRNLRELSRTLASTCRFNGQSFPSLAELFGVSPGAMAIRLEELGLVGPNSI